MTPEAVGFLGSRFKPVVGVFLLVVASAPGELPLASSPPAFLIAVQALPEWAPGNPLTIRHVVVDGRGAGQVVTTREEDGRVKVLHVGSLRLPPAELERWMQQREEFKAFYGFDENADPSVVVEGHPQAVVFSFFRDGRLSKTVSLSGDTAYTQAPGGEYRVPEALIALRNALFAYADEATPETRAARYLRVVPYGADETHWLLKSTTMEEIPVMTDRADARDRRFFEEVKDRMPAFFPLDEERFTRIRRNLGLDRGRQRATFRASRDDERIVQLRLMDGTASGGRSLQ